MCSFLPTFQLHPPRNLHKTKKRHKLAISPKLAWTQACFCVCIALTTYAHSPGNPSEARIDQEQTFIFMKETSVL
jgi:mRNA-degrading endonuclease toxin of MazEF toxin-antitoxin module